MKKKHERTVWQTAMKVVDIVVKCSKPGPAMGTQHAEALVTEPFQCWLMSCLQMSSHGPCRICRGTKGVPCPVYCVGFAAGAVTESKPYQEHVAASSFCIGAEEEGC